MINRRLTVKLFVHQLSIRANVITGHRLLRQHHRRHSRVMNTMYMLLVIQYTMNRPIWLPCRLKQLPYRLAHAWTMSIV
jgi:hypothetical protein